MTTDTEPADDAGVIDTAEVTTAVAKFDRVVAGLNDLKNRYAGVVFDVRTPKGMAEARAARAAVRAPRYELENARKSAKAPLLKLGRDLDARAKEINTEILAIEDPIDLQVRSEEDRIEAEKQAKIDAENKRIADIQSRIAAIRNWPMVATGKPASLVEQQLRDAEHYVVSQEQFQEFTVQAAEALLASQASLRTILAERIEFEAEQARAQAERAELAQLRADQLKREAEERIHRAEQERQAEAQRKAEAERQAAELAQQQAALRQEREENERLARQRQEELDRRASEDEAARIEAQRSSQMALSEIQGIQQQVMIASVGRAGVREGGTIECIRETLFETELWTIDDRFGIFIGSAQQAKDSAIAAIKALLASRIEHDRLDAAREAQKAEDQRKTEQARLASIQKPPDEEILLVLARHYAVTVEKIVDWITTMDLGRFATPTEDAEVPAPRKARTKSRSAGAQA
jgi:hypothetical protein